MRMVVRIMVKNKKGNLIKMKDNYSNFPFNDLTEAQIISLIAESIKLKDFDFVCACMNYLESCNSEFIKIGKNK